MDEIKKTKIERLIKAGKEVYPARVNKLHSFSEIKEQLKTAEAGQKLDQNDVLAAGRVAQLRWMGKACFLHLQNGTDKLQIYLRADEPGLDYQLFIDTAEVGDFIEIKGFPFKTRTGEATVHAKSSRMLAKAVLGMPEKWHGLKDTEIRYRQRYLDLIANPQVSGIFKARSRLVGAVRRVLDGRGFLEVETPIFQAQAGGAAAKPFMTFHEALETDLYLRIATELHLKRLIVGGLERVYEIGKCFRNEGIDTSHNPEFTMLEAYQSYADYEDMADLTEEIVRKAYNAAAPASQNIVFERRRMPEIWQKALGFPLEFLLDDPYHFNRAKLEACAKEHGVAFDPKGPSHKIFDKILDLKIIAGLPEFCFLFDYPMAVSPLAKGKSGHPEWVERFELFRKGTELANAFSELNDPEEQRRRMEVQVEAKQKEGDEEAPPLDEDFIAALAHGMPPTGGLGIGIDRLCMVILGIDSIREVILFPTLKPEKGRGLRVQG
ncbi:MAG: lysine--tRNA ligase [Elusimicrobia bacterium]|nr:lysine--tRNA ligase [Elusimicrobiota bacterium]